MTPHADPPPTATRRRRAHQRQRASERRQRHRRNGPRTAGPLPRRWWQRARPFHAVPSRRAIGVRVYTCALLGFALAETLAQALVRDREIDTTVLLALAALAIAHAVDQLLQRRVLRQHSYGWYCRTFPAHVRPDGRIACRHCGDRRIHWQSLPHRNDYRAHVCTGCSATLFYRQDPGR